MKATRREVCVWNVAFQCQISLSPPFPGQNHLDNPIQSKDPANRSANSPRMVGNVLPCQMKLGYTLVSGVSSFLWRVGVPPLLLESQDSCLDLKISKILFNLRLCDCSVSLTLVLESPSCELTKPTENTIWSFPPNLQCSLCWVSEVNWWKEWLKDTAANRR